MFAESIAGVRVTETKPLRRVSGWPWWRILLFSIFFHYRVRTGVGEEVGFWPSERMFSNPRRKKRYERREHYVKYLIRGKHK